MPTLNGRLTIDGPIVDLIIGVPEEKRRVLESAGRSAPIDVSIPALIDTGANVTAVSGRILEMLGLFPVDSVPVLLPSGKTRKFNRFYVDLSLHGDNQTLRLASKVVLESSFAPKEECQGLIGRDVLRHCEFHYNGPNQTFSLSF